MKSATLLVFFVAVATSFAQSTDPLTAERYLMPPKDVADIVLAPRHLNFGLTNPNPGRTAFCITNSGGMSDLARISAPYVTLAGDQFDIRANRDRQLTTSSAEGLFLIDAATGRRTNIKIPAGVRVSGASWSPKGTWLGFLMHSRDATHIAIADPKTGDSRVVTQTPLLATLSTNFDWSMDEKWIFAVVIPKSRPPMPTSGPVPSQPKVFVSEPSRNRSRPVRGLLETEADKQLLEYFITGQLAKIEVATGQVLPIGQPAMIRSFSAAPDGSAFRVTTVLKPFSYVVGISGFGSREALVDPSGKEITELSKRELRFEIGPPAAGAEQPRRDERRSLAWRPDGNGLSFIQREPEPERPATGNPPPSNEQGGRGGRGNPPAAEPSQGQGPRRRDRVMHWVPPYGKDDAKVIYEQDESITSVQYSPDCKTIFVGRSVSGRSEIVAVNLETKATTVVSSSRADDFFNQPGSLVTTSSVSGQSAILVSPSGSVFLRGVQYDRDPLQNAPRPFLDRVALTDGKKERIWQSAADTYETVETPLDPEFTKFIVSRQSPTSTPNSFVYDSSTKSFTQLTSNRDLTPTVTQAKRFRVRVTRNDGISFWVKVTMPSWWMEGTKLPAMFWFYPSEFVDQKAYDDGQRTFNKNTFPATSARSMTILTLYGYAVIEPDCPIIGLANAKNDAYVPQLRNNLSATIDELDRLGYIDRSRLAIGGHSYGAFSTANAMIHTPFFKAGLAGDGCYLRMLTPMQFQAETRLLWEARETYLNMSPLIFAEQMTGALLMYHGADDLNPGTHPINSERMFNALDGLGKDVALYVYPYEDHNAIAKESVLDLWARWIPWIEKYVKNAGKKG